MLAVRKKKCTHGTVRRFEAGELAGNSFSRLGVAFGKSRHRVTGLQLWLHTLPLAYATQFASSRGFNIKNSFGFFTKLQIEGCM